MTKLICRSCAEVHKAPYKPMPDDFDCPCGGTRCLPSELKPRKPLKRTSKLVSTQGGASSEPKSWSSLKRGRQRETKAEKEARQHFNEVVKSWPCWFKATRPCELCEGEGQVAKNFGIDSPGRPEIVTCPVCNGDGKHHCRYPKDAHHILRKSFIRQRCSDWSEPDLLAVLYNPLIGAPLCRKAHEAVTAGTDRIYWQDLSPECLEYIGSLPDFFLLRLDLECPKRQMVEREGVAA